MNFVRRYFAAWVLIFGGLFFADSLDNAGAQAVPNNFVLSADAARRYPTAVRSAPTYVNYAKLVAATSQTITMPATARIVVFSGSCNFWAIPGSGPAVIPGASVTDGTAAELNPSAWYFANAATATQAISLISAGACDVTLTGYAGPLM